MRGDGMVRRARSLAASLRSDEGRLTVEGAKVWDEDSGEYVVSTAVIYEGPARIRVQDMQADRLLVLGDPLTASEFVLSLPVEVSVAVPVDARFTVTASRHDVDLVGRVFRVLGPHVQSQSSARRFRVELLS